MRKLFTFIAATAFCLSVSAQEDLLVGKPVYTLGDAKSWNSSNGATYTFVTDDLNKLVLAETNKSNIFLFPQDGGGWDTPENQSIGIQGFYIDLGEIHRIGSVTTTWEGAAANNYSIYLTDVEPTLDILATQPTYSASNLGQYTTNVAVLPDNSEGRYLVFQPTDATNWGWGVKIRSISASAPTEDVLTSFTVSPGIIIQGKEHNVTIAALNQFGLPIDVDLKVEGDGEIRYEDNKLTIISGTYAQFSATYDDVTLTSRVYAAFAPQLPDVTNIKTPIFSNTVTDYNGDVEWTVNYNGGAVNNGLLEFENGEVAQSFGNAACIFFSNKTTTGAWNGNINPEEKGYRSLKLDVFSPKNVQCSIEFESVTGLDGHTFYFDLTAGEWTPLEVNVLGASKLGNLSIRFTESNMTDILLSNIYFTSTFVEGDNEAPELSDITLVNQSLTYVEISFSATDNLCESIIYYITVGENNYSVQGNNGETINFTISDLMPGTEYEISVVASDGINNSAEKTLNVVTESHRADSIDLSLLYEYPLAGETVSLIYSLFDQEGQPYETEQAPEFTVIEGDAEINENNVTFNAKGNVTIQAKLEDVIQLLEVSVIADINDYVMENATVCSDTDYNEGARAFDGGSYPSEKGIVYIVVDDNMEKAGAHEHWILAELDKAYNLDMIIAIWEGASPADYDVYVGESEDNLTKVYNVSGHGLKEYHDRLFGQEMTNVKFIKIETHINSTDYGIKLFDLKAYGQPAQSESQSLEQPVVDNTASNSEVLIVRVNKNHDLWYKIDIYDPNAKNEKIVAFADVDNTLFGYTKVTDADSDEYIDAINEDETNFEYRFNVAKMLSSQGLTDLSQLDNDKKLSLSLYAQHPETKALSDEMLVGVGADGTTTGVEDVATDNQAVMVDIYNLQGLKVRQAVESANTLDGLPAGIYIVNGKKFMVR